MSLSFQNQDPSYNPELFKNLAEYPLYLDDIMISNKQGDLNLVPLCKSFPLSLNLIQHFELKKSPLKDHALISWAIVFIRQLKVASAPDYFFRAIIDDESVTGYDSAKIVLRSNTNIHSLWQFAAEEFAIIKMFMLVRNSAPDGVNLTEDWSWFAYLLSVGYCSIIDHRDILYTFLLFCDEILRVKNCSLGFFENSEGFLAYKKQHLSVVKHINGSVLIQKKWPQPQPNFSGPIYFIPFFVPMEDQSNITAGQLLYIISCIAFTIDHIANKEVQYIDDSRYTHGKMLEVWENYSIDMVKNKKSEENQTVKRSSLPEQLPTNQDNSDATIESMETAPDNTPAVSPKSGPIYNPDEATSDLFTEVTWAPGSKTELFIRKFLELNEPEQGEVLYQQSPSLLSYIIHRNGSILPDSVNQLKQYLETQLKFYYESLWPTTHHSHSRIKENITPPAADLQAIALKLQDIHQDIKSGFQSLVMSPMNQVSSNIDTMTHMMASLGSLPAITALQTSTRNTSGAKAEGPQSIIQPVPHSLPLSRPYPTPIATTSRQAAINDQDAETRRIIAMMMAHEAKSKDQIIPE